MATVIRVYVIRCFCLECNGKKPYIGSTSRSVKWRFNKHRFNIKTGMLTSKFYTHVRQTGSVEDLQVKKLDKLKLTPEDLKDKTIRRKFEQKYIDFYDSIVNGWNTYNSYTDVKLYQKKYAEINKNRFVCEKCNFSAYNIRDYNKHLQTNRHNGISFCCEVCDYTTTSRKYFNKHLRNPKHTLMILRNVLPNSEICL